MIITPCPDLSAPTPESRPRTAPRLRPAQAAPVRRDVPTYPGIPANPGGVGITPADYGGPSYWYPIFD